MKKIDIAKIFTLVLLIFFIASCTVGMKLKNDENWECNITKRYHYLLAHGCYINLFITKNPFWDWIVEDVQ